MAENSYVFCFIKQSSYKLILRFIRFTGAGSQTVQASGYALPEEAAGTGLPGGIRRGRLPAARQLKEVQVHFPFLCK